VVERELIIRDGAVLRTAGSGRPYFYSGVNNYYLAIDNTRREVVDEIVTSMAAMGMTVLRTWAFNEAQDKETKLQGPLPRMFIEENFRMLDYTLDRLAAGGMRAILALTNYWPAYGGMRQYVAWNGGGTRAEAVYQHDSAQRDYRRFVETLVTRVNTCNGREYRVDPTILAWQVANEPRNERASRGETSALTRWVNETASFLKRTLGVAQLVSVGMEGFYARGNAKAGGKRWMDACGTDFIEQHASDDIDLMGFHLYPDHWKLTGEEAERWIVAHARDARQLGKPVVLDEVGRMVPPNSMAVRDESLRRYLRVASDEGVCGANVWMLSHNGHPNFDNFAFYFPGDVSTVEVLREHAERVRGMGERRTIT
jgi:mannan endo-1,4-beta-mannosidase